MVRKLARRVVPERIRRMARGAWRLITGWYVRSSWQGVHNLQVHSVTQVAQLEAQSEAIDLILRRLRGFEEQVTGSDNSLAAQVNRLEQEVRAQINSLAEATRSLEYQQVLLRTHLNASGVLGPMNMKARTLEQLYKEADTQTPPDAAVVEVGCMRYPFESPQEGASTLYLAQWCRESGRPFVSIDLEYAENARNILTQHGLPGEVIEGDGESAIAALTAAIGFLYLDGSNDPAHTLGQLRAAEGKLVPGALIAIDDVQQVEANPEGKGQLAIPYAVEHGWEVEILKTEPGYRMAALRLAATGGARPKDDLVRAERE